MIIAVDFDGVLVEDQFPNIGKTDWEMVTSLWRLEGLGHEIVLWTCRVNDKLEEAKQWCKDHGLKFTCVNSNTPTNLNEYGTDPRKVFAHVYIDDRAIGYTRAKALKFLNKLYLEEMNKDDKR